MTISFEDWKAGLESRSRRRELLRRDGRPQYILMSQQFRREDIDSLCDTATAVRRLDRHVDGRDFLRSMLRGHRVMNLFAQPSTRTAESFIAAAHKLGADSRLVSDLRTSSFSKGESIEDAVRTLSSFFDAIVTRHQDDEFATRAAWALYNSGRPIPVISAGSGKSQHVTQSLLDIYTLRYSFLEHGGIDKKRIVIIGDVARNRAARSLAYLLTRFERPRIHFVSPEAFAPDDALLAYLRKHEVEASVHTSLGPTLKDLSGQVDAIYVTRLQQEWDRGNNGIPDAGERGSSDEYVLKPEYKTMVRPDTVIMHPLPRVNELPEAWESHPGFMVWRQVRNGMWIRAALFAQVFGADAEIRDRAARLKLL